MSTILGLNGSPVGVRIVQSGEKPELEDQKIPMRFCQALMRARHGHSDSNRCLSHSGPGKDWRDLESSLMRP